MTETEAFERAFVATAYLLGCRAELARGLGPPTKAAARLAENLASGDRPERARRLAAELRPIVEALDARRLW
ncbi:MAG TPA: hypothetical protein VF395_04430 [Polyangiaceae bacterium]